MKVILCGYGEAGKKCLGQLLLRNDLPPKNIFVYSHEGDNNFNTFLENSKIPYCTNSINNELKTVSTFNPDYLVSTYYRHIINDDVLDLVNFKAINAHPSLLPDYRGCFSSVWAIINGENETGISFHYMTRNVDQGNILHQIKMPIESEDTAYTLYHKLIGLTTENINIAFTLLINNDKGTPTTILPEHRYYKRQVPFDGILEAKSTSYDKAQKFVRAMHFPPFEGAKFNIDGTEVEINTVEDLKKYDLHFN